MTKSSLEIPGRAWNFLLSRIQNFENNRLARIPTTLNQQGTLETREEIFLSTGAEEMDLCRYEQSDLKDKEIIWENPQLDLIVSLHKWFIFAFLH